MNTIERLWDAGANLVTTAIVATGGGVLWLIRHVNTNGKQIDMLRTEIDARDALRAADSKRLEELHMDVRELRAEIRQS